MTEASVQRDGDRRPWLVDALVGGGLALGLITIAHASLPKVEPRATEAVSQRTAAPAVQHAVPQQPAALIAFQDPLPGYGIGSPYGLRQLPWEDEGRLHAGVDIAAPGGEPIRAVADGVIVRVGQGGGYGRFVEVKHAQGLSTLYGHMGGFAPNLRPGMAVKAGQPVGQIGSTGTSTGSHLHFEIHDPKGRPLNPELFLGRQFAEAGDLPLRAGLRVPRYVRVAYVSMIPKSKQAVLDAKLEAELEAELAAAEAAERAAEEAKAAKAAKLAAAATTAPAGAAAAGDAAKDASAVQPAPDAPEVRGLY